MLVRMHLVIWAIITFTTTHLFAERAFMATYSSVAWIAQYFLVLDSKERSPFLYFGRSFLSRQDAASPAIL
jgi:hypothetical protein